MARCGCGSGCFCFHEDGACTTTTGAGSETAPYVVNVVVGSQADNTLECTDQGLYVPPAAETITTLVDNGDGTVTYTNEDGDAVTVNVCDLLADGGCTDSLTAEDNGNGTLTVTHTALDGTVTQFVVDGNGAIGVDDTQTVDLTVTNGIITADAILDCGLVETPAGIAVDVPAWTYPCPEDEGAPVGCDANGQLRAPPEHFTVQDHIRSRIITGAVDPTTLGPVDGNQFDVGTPVPFDIVNPSDCRDLIVTIRYGIFHAQVEFAEGDNSVRPIVAIESPPGTPIGGAFSSVHQAWATQGVPAGQEHTFDSPAYQELRIVVPAGGTFTGQIVGRLQLNMADSTLINNFDIVVAWHGSTTA